MAKNFYQDGTTMDWSNSTGKAVLSGQAVPVGAMAGVAHADIPDGGSGVLHTVGVWILPKVEADTWARGAKLYLTEDGKLTATEGDVIAGTAWITSGAGETDSHVRLGY